MLDTNSIEEEILLGIIDLLYKVSWKILSYLKANKDIESPITSKALQEVFGSSGGTISTHLSRLERLGLIEREKQGKNKDIYITELGEYFVP